MVSNIIQIYQMFSDNVGLMLVTYDHIFSFSKIDIFDNAENNNNSNNNNMIPLN